MKFITKIKSNSFLKAYKLFLWLERLYVKYIFGYRSKARLIILLTILIEYLDKYKDKPAEYRHKLASAVVDRLLKNNTLCDDEFIQDNNIVIKYECEQELNKQNIKKYVTNYFKINSFAYSYFDKVKQKNEIDKLCEIGCEDDPINTKTFGCIAKDISKKYKIVKNQFVNEVKRRKNTSVKPKIVFNMSISEVSAIIGLTSVLFLLSGFIYNEIFFSYFGIKLSMFFTVNDYISTSVEKIYYLLLSLIINLIFAFMYWSPGYVQLRSEMSKVRLIFEDLPTIMLMLMVPVMAVVLSVYGFPERFLLIGFSLLMVVEYFVSKIKDNFENPIFSYLVISYACMFFIFLISTAFMNREEIVKYDKHVNNNCQIELDSSANIINKNLILLGVNSNYSFVYSSAENKSYVISNKNVTKYIIPFSKSRTIFDSLFDLYYILFN